MTAKQNNQADQNKQVIQLVLGCIGATIVGFALFVVGIIAIITMVGNTLAKEFDEVSRQVNEQPLQLPEGDDQP